MRQLLLTFVFFSLLLSPFAPPLWAQSQLLTMKDIPINWNDFSHKNIHDKHAFDAKTDVEYGASGAFKIDKSQKTVQLELSFYARMNKEKSYVKKSFLKTADSARSRKLLNHELGHWIISMIYYHQLVHDLETFPYDYRVRQQMDSILYKNQAQCRLEQMQYDSATNHSKNIAAQAQWETQLLSRLTEAFEGKIPTFPEEISMDKTVSW